MRLLANKSSARRELPQELQQILETGVLIEKGRRVNKEMEKMRFGNKSWVRR
jgi:hypothetical protein